MTPTPREVALRALKMQRHIRDVEALNAILDATAQGHITSPATLRKFVEDRTKLVTSSTWANTHWKKLETFKASSGTCTDLVVVGTTYDDDEDGVEAPAPSDSMKQLTSVMRNLYARKESIPLVPPTPDDPGSLSPQRPEFDRNDLYLTNARELARVLGHPVDPKYTLCMVCLVNTNGAKYVTWCELCNVDMFMGDVNGGRVVLNRYATEAIGKGSVFAHLDVLDDDMGQLEERHIDNVVYGLEMFTNMNACRFPRGLNVTNSPHLVHRSLRMIGGDWGVLQSLGKYTRAQAIFHSSRDIVHARAREATTNIEQYSAVSGKFSASVRDAMYEKCVCKRDQVRKVYLKGAKRDHVNMHISAGRLNQSVDSAVAEIALSGQTPPPALLGLYVPLTTDEFDQLSACVDAIPDLTSCTDVTRALMDLYMWDGKGPIPQYGHDDIRDAYRSAQRRVHSDKTGLPQTVLPETIKEARDFLYKHVAS